MTLTLVSTEFPVAPTPEALVASLRGLRARQEELDAEYEALASELRDMASELREPGQATVAIGGARVQWQQTYAPLTDEDLCSLGELGAVADELAEERRVIAMRKDCDSAAMWWKLHCAGHDPALYLVERFEAVPVRGADERVARLAARHPDDLAVASAAAIIATSQRTPRVLL